MEARSCAPAFAIFFRCNKKALSETGYAKQQKIKNFFNSKTNKKAS